MKEYRFEVLNDHFHHFLVIEKPEDNIGKITMKNNLETLFFRSRIFNESLLFICEKQVKSFFRFINNHRPSYTFFYFRGSESTYSLSKENLELFKDLDDKECLVKTIEYKFFFKLYTDLFLNKK